MIPPVSRCILLGDGTAGAEKQCLALAKRLRVPSYEMLRLPLLPAFRYLSPRSHIQLSALLNTFVKTTPWLGYSHAAVENALSARKTSSRKQIFPDLVIACGRTTAPLSCAIRKESVNGDKSRRQTFTIQIQHPRCPPEWFDAIITPEHDFLSLFPPRSGSNVYLAQGSLHEIDAEWIEEGRQKYLNQTKQKTLIRPYVMSIIIGGTQKNCRWEKTDLELLVPTITNDFISENGTHSRNIEFYFICSRRTPDAIAQWIKHYVSQLKNGEGVNAHSWINGDSECDNPYHMALSVSDRIVVTSDSVSMLSECMALKPPLGLFAAFSEKCRGKHARFVDSLGIELL